MRDLTAITTPFGLLDEATREALKAHGGPYECFRENFGRYGWNDPLGSISIDTHPALAWRVKPKTREAWIELDENGRFVQFHKENPQFISGGHRCTLWRDTAK